MAAEDGPCGPYSSPDSRPVITTPRLRGEPVVKRHAAAMAKVLGDPRAYRYLSDDPPTIEHLERQYDLLTAGKSPDGEEHWLTWTLVPRRYLATPLGFIQATVREPETVHIAYVLSPAHWGKGYAREAISGMLDAVFKRYEVPLAIAEMDTRNEASIALAESLGFYRIGTNRDADHFKGSTSHEHEYQLPRSQWRRRS